MADPDAPTRYLALLGPIAHWLQTNVKVSETGTIEKDAPMAPYAGPGPPPYTGYNPLFQMYSGDEGQKLNNFAQIPPLHLPPLPQHEGVLPFEKQSTIKGIKVKHRMRWDIAKFVQENGLELVGAK
jgi:hypothetical protein